MNRNSKPTHDQATLLSQFEPILDEINMLSVPLLLATHDGESDEVIVGRAEALAEKVREYIVMFSRYINKLDIENG